MIPFRTSAHAANSSPSVALEKGAYRMRAPYPRPPTKLLFSRSPVRNRRVDTLSTSQNLAMLVLLLALACLSCFGMAYYLFSTRWDARALSQQPSANQPHRQVVNIDFREQNSILPDPHERFLAYLPHSGFHNQRIALENALVLARLLNRTLLVPPVWLGNKPLRYLNFNALSQALALSDKDGLFHCSQIPSHIPSPMECTGYFDYTHISWDWLVDLSETKKVQHLRQRWNMTDAWITEHLRISEVDIWMIKDTSPYHYRILDTVTDTSPLSHKFLETLYLPDLATSTKRLIHFGTLFGSSRLRLKNSTNVAIRASIRQSMTFSNVILIDASYSIAKSMGHLYIGGHLRLGDGDFQRNGRDNARMLWWKLMHNVLHYTQEETADIERVVLNLSKTWDPPPLPIDETQNFTRPRLWKSQTQRLACRGTLHTRRDLRPLNIPLFISTDVDRPEHNPLLLRFYRTFPCVFHLSDFPKAMASLRELQNANDGVMLNDFLLPFLDAMVVAHAWMVVGTEKSTFSRFVEDVLWRMYHGMEIIQRG
ncbi:hypothetical protein Hypma_008009 [Hypsizygus marmoreus]|uniref:Uncharacterized protein n=1 Tax=Hypsizygus marmoreus TaxID=39966 RepID=A0A369JRB5_HYPMA|nr:hypothetical protein Hypma_008009 [Hypsizygus marmoreus]